MSGKPPPPKPQPAAENVAPKIAHERYVPKSSVATRNAYAEAMNAGNRTLAAKLKIQMDAEEAAARKR